MKKIEKVNGMGKKQTCLDFGDYEISFADVSTGDFMQGDSETETAIVSNGKFYILNGNHLEAYEGAKSLKECMDYFSAHPEEKSSWSDTP